MLHYADLQTKAETAFRDLLLPAVTDGSPCWSDLKGNPVLVQRGVEDSTVTVPCVICFSDRSAEAVYGTQVLRVNVNIQILSFIREGAEIHRQRVSAIEHRILSFDPDHLVTGEYRALAAALCNHPNRFHCSFVIPGESTAGISDNETWVFNRQYEVICEWVNLGTSSSE